MRGGEETEGEQECREGEKERREGEKERREGEKEQREGVSPPAPKRGRFHTAAVRAKAGCR